MCPLNVRRLNIFIKFFCGLIYSIHILVLTFVFFLLQTKDENTLQTKVLSLEEEKHQLENTSKV